MLLDVPNRSNRVAMRSFNMAPFDPMPTDEIVPGDGFLLERGWTAHGRAEIGAKFDVPFYVLPPDHADSTTPARQ